MSLFIETIPSNIIVIAVLWNCLTEIAVAAYHTQVVSTIIMSISNLCGKGCCNCIPRNFALCNRWQVTFPCCLCGCGKQNLPFSLCVSFINVWLILFLLFLSGEPNSSQIYTSSVVVIWGSPAGKVGNVYVSWPMCEIFHTNTSGYISV